MSNVEERPITLTAEEVRAILGPGKTQTRRPIELIQYDKDCPGLTSDFIEHHYASKYGKPGDRLSVPGEPGLTLEITELRAERLADISEEDAEAEGVESCCDGCGELFDIEKNALGYCWVPECGVDSFSHQAGFRKLWDSIYGKTYPFDSNPWVWVIGFKKIEKETA